MAEPPCAEVRKSEVPAQSQEKQRLPVQALFVSGNLVKVITMNTIIWLVAMILNLFAISDVLGSGRDLTTKIVLIALILLLPFIGAGLYLFAFRDKGYNSV